MNKIHLFKINIFLGGILKKSKKKQKKVKKWKNIQAIEIKIQKKRKSVTKS